MTTIKTTAGFAACVLMLLGAATDPPARQEDASVPSRNVESGLDERIDAGRITEQDVPPLLEQVILPMPPVHRIAAQGEQVPISDEHWQRARLAIARGLVYLRKQQSREGGWLIGETVAPTDQPDRPSPVALAVTALAVKAFVQADEAAVAHLSVQQALQFIIDARRADGSFDDSALANYVTATVVSALASADSDEFADEVRGGTTWLQAAQWDEGEGLRPRQDWFGGAGYGSRGRPDLSNTQVMLEALYDAGMSPDEPAFQRAVAFMSRAQNLEETNASAWTGNDGGFVYTPANGGESMASEAAGEGRHGELLPAGGPRSLRSYGSMTYAGFKSMLYAGMSPDDPRVRAAFNWIREHWTFDENPGLGAQGLYYYYHTMARALRIAQQNDITGADGTSHNWREEMIDAIGSRQNSNGSWKNDADRWLEGEPVMATVFAVLALEEALKPVAGVE